MKMMQYHYIPISRQEDLKQNSPDNGIPDLFNSNTLEKSEKSKPAIDEMISVVLIYFHHFPTPFFEFETYKMKSNLHEYRCSTSLCQLLQQSWRSQRDILLESSCSWVGSTATLGLWGSGRLHNNLSPSTCPCWCNSRCKHHCLLSPVASKGCMWRFGSTLERIFFG